MTDAEAEGPILWPPVTLELDRGGGCTNIAIVLNATELCTLKL